MDIRTNVSPWQRTHTWQDGDVHKTELTMPFVVKLGFPPPPTTLELSKTFRAYVDIAPPGADGVVKTIPKSMPISKRE